MGGEVIAIYTYIYIYIRYIYIRYIYIYIYIYIYRRNNKWLRSTMSLQFSDFLVLSLALSVVPATSSDVNK